MMPRVIEKGDVYWFYRNKTAVHLARGLDDVQRMYLLLLPDDRPKGRMFIVGKKRMPRIVHGRSRSTQREWMMNVAVARPDRLAEGLRPEEYDTATRGRRRQDQAIPTAAGRYILYADDGDTRLACRLTRPKEPGEAQAALGIGAEAVYLISVRNPDIQVRGFPEASPDYPATLRRKFADERWLGITDRRLLDYEGAQFVLIGTEEGGGSTAVRVTGRADLFKRLGLKKGDWPTAALDQGRFAEPTGRPAAVEPETDRSKGGRRGGRRAAGRPSAAGIARALKGIDFPSRRPGLVRHARHHGARPGVVDVLGKLPDRRFNNMADVEKALAEVR